MTPSTPPYPPHFEVHPTRGRKVREMERVLPAAVPDHLKTCGQSARSVDHRSPCPQGTLWVWAETGAIGEG